MSEDTLTIGSETIDVDLGEEIIVFAINELDDAWFIPRIEDHVINVFGVTRDTATRLVALAITLKTNRDKKLRRG